MQVLRLRRGQNPHTTVGNFFYKNRLKFLDDRAGLNTLIEFQVYLRSVLSAIDVMRSGIANKVVRGQGFSYGNLPLRMLRL